MLNRRGANRASGKQIPGFRVNHRQSGHWAENRGRVRLGDHSGRTQFQPCTASFVTTSFAANDLAIDLLSIQTKPLRSPDHLRLGISGTAAPSPRGSEAPKFMPVALSRSTALPRPMFAVYSLRTSKM